MKEKLSYFSKFEIGLFLFSTFIIISAFLFGSSYDFLSLTAALVGLIAVTYLAKGHIMGQLATIVFCLMYGYISFQCNYYGEMITYLCMTLPMAVVATMAWFKNPFKGDDSEVEIAHITKKQLIFLIFATISVTIIFFFILRYFGNASLLLSTLSIATSFVAAYFTYCRSPFYALGYAANDIVLIILWMIVAVNDTTYLTIVMNFVVFLINDLHGYVCWKKRKLKQTEYYDNN